MIVEKDFKSIANGMKKIQINKKNYTMDFEKYNSYAISKLIKIINLL